MRLHLFISFLIGLRFVGSYNSVVTWRWLIILLTLSMYYFPNIIKLLALNILFNNTYLYIYVLSLHQIEWKTIACDITFIDNFVYWLFPLFILCSLSRENELLTRVELFLPSLFIIYFYYLFRILLNHGNIKCCHIIIHFIHNQLF